MKTLYSLLFIIIYFTGILHAQSDTLKAGELEQIRTGSNESSMAYFQRMAGLSDYSDSIKASEQLLKITPYYLMWEWRNTQRPDTMLAAYILTTDARAKCLAQYDSAFHAPKSDAYLRFEKMAEEDQLVRHMLEKCADTFSCRKINERMRRIDSTNFSFLYSYVTEYGWPTIENGSLNATLLAIHDHAHHNFYMPYLKKAAAKGQVSISALLLINHFITTSMTNEELLKIINSKNHIKINISEMIHNEMPRASRRIQKIFSESCGKPFRFYYIFETPLEQHFSDWSNLQHNKPGDDRIIRRFQKELQPFCKSKIIDPCVWHISRIVAEQTKLFMVIVYD
ncbi:MAG: hypothetical protein H6550_04020 [Chitinophagales bacterium]|nr:hypothetical protein [Chitinophagales bacterium]